MQRLTPESLLPVPAIRITRENAQPERALGRFVLYWMIGARRSTHNFALDRARELAALHDRPLLVFEPLRLNYPWASERTHTFVVQGMRDNAAAFERAGITYFPYVESRRDEGTGLLAELARHACAVVTDDVPGFFLPRMVRAAAERIGVALESVDGNGLYPLQATDRVFSTAHSFRRHLQHALPAHLAVWPATSLAPATGAPASIPQAVKQRWPAANLLEPAALQRLLGSLPIARAIPSVPTAGGSVAAGRLVTEFVTRKIARYHDERSEPELDAASGLSPYLHFGHVATHAVFEAVAAHECWDPSQAGGATRGEKRGFWGMSESAEGFLDELITWRELGFHAAKKLVGFDRYETVPAWARASLERHARDPRPHRYSIEELAQSRTHDPIWNAAQRQLVRDGTMHNYLRMLWGKKVLEWSPSPSEAFARLVDLNNTFALDGRDPNSISGISWCFGRYDRPWGPERPIFGVVRYMSSENTRRKFSLTRYLERFGPLDEGGSHPC